MKNGEKPINPVFNSDGFAMEFDENEKLDNHSLGLTKREYFAGLAMQGLLANPNLRINEPEKIALLFVVYADEILKQLENETTK